MRKKGVSVKAIQTLDKIAIERLGIPSVVLMENAGHGVARETLSFLRNPKKSRASVFCGIGNNAGDGFVAARHLIDEGVQTKVFLIGDYRKLKEDPAINYHILKKLRCPTRAIRRANKELLEDIKSSDVIIDAIFGIGLNREVIDPFKSVISILNSVQKPIVSVDTPSGLDGTTGKIYGICVKADMTVTFSLPKEGFFKNDGPKYCGKVVVVDIGIPEKLLQKIAVLH